MNEKTIQELKEGCSKAENAIFAHYFERLTRQASSVIKQTKTLATNEDVAASAIRSAIEGMQNLDSVYQNICAEESLARLLVTITRRKAFSALRFSLAKKRDVRKTHDLDSYTPFNSEPTPQEVIIFNEIYSDFLAKLSSEQRLVLERYHSRHDKSSIAKELGRSVRTVDLILRQLKQLLREVSEQSE